MIGLQVCFASQHAPQLRAPAFAINILIIHMLGDVISPPIIGLIAGVSDLHTAFLVVATSIPLGGLPSILGFTSAPDWPYDVR